MPKTRQQQRARSRSPLRRRRNGTVAFTIFIVALLTGGGVLAFFSRAHPPPITRGASIGEHWHASYKVYICGKRMTNFPTIEGQLHSHGDGFMHIHPQTQAFAGPNANLSNFLQLYETTLTQLPDGKRQLVFPDGTKHTDGDTCPNDHKRYDIVVTNKGKKIGGNPGLFTPHQGDAVVIAFGPQGEGTFPNPYSKVKGIPDAGLGGNAPANDTGARQTPRAGSPSSPQPSG